VAHVVLDPFTEAGGTEEQAALALTAGCVLIEPENPYDSYSFNQHFTGLLSGWGAEFGGGGVQRDSDDVTHALFSECQAHGADPDAFLDGVAGRLQLSAPELQQAIDQACTRYLTRKANGLENPSDESAFDVVPPAVTALLGDSLTPEALVGAYCG
jgi:hypothetical protein